MSRKIKYSLEFKLAIIGQVLSREKPLDSISRENGIERRMVYQWVQFYQRFGEAGLIPQSTDYSLENKLEVIRYFISNKVSLRAACLHFNIRCNSVLSNWLRIYESAGAEGLSETTRGKHRLMKPKIPKKAPSLLTDHEQVLEENNRLRAEVAFLKKLRALIQKEESKEKQKALIIQGLRNMFDLPVLLEVAGMARSSFYYHMKCNGTADRYGVVRGRLNELYKQHKGRYGYRRMLLQLKKEGHIINHKTVLRLTGEMGLKSAVRLKKYRSYKEEENKTVPNILNREFNVDRPFEKWATDVTEFNVTGKKLYLSTIIDLFNGEIISYSQSLRPDFGQVTDMLDLALKKKPGNAKPMLHSDQGWQYKMKSYQGILLKNGIIQSMSRKGNCLDNAVMENFFGTLKSEMFYRKKYLSVEELKGDVDEYISYYNNKRIRLNLNGMSPVEYRTQVLNN